MNRIVLIISVLLTAVCITACSDNELTYVTGNSSGEAVQDEILKEEQVKTGNPEHSDSDVNRTDGTVLKSDELAESARLSESEEPEGKTKQNKNDGSKKDSVILIHVCGAVKNQGVYELPIYSRVYEAVEAAGGFDDLADRSAVNLVKYLEDEQQLYFPYQGEQIIIQQEPDWTDPRVNINLATEEELCTLNGIGKTRAQAIIRYREEAGGFTATQDIMKVEGIKNSLYEKIKDDIRTE